MGRRRTLPDGLGEAFSVSAALAAGAGRGRLRGPDLARPFHGVRTRHGEGTAESADPFETQRTRRAAVARDYAPRLHPDHFFSHHTAASIWAAPLPLAFTATGEIDADPDLHVSAMRGAALPRAAGIVRHRADPRLHSVREHRGLRVSSPATTWASMGSLPLADLIALGDHFCRCWRSGHGRPDPGRPALATIAQLQAAIDAGRRVGIGRLREAIGWIREDSWSPRESILRYALVSRGLPEPELNVDVHDGAGRFIGCVDMAYRVRRVAVEYLGMLHGDSWANDVERIAGLRAAGWTVIEVTAPLLARPDELVRRVAAALAR